MLPHRKPGSPQDHLPRTCWLAVLGRDVVASGARQCGILDFHVGRRTAEVTNRDRDEPSFAV